MYGGLSFTLNDVGEVLAISGTCIILTSKKARAMHRFYLIQSNWNENKYKNTFRMWMWMWMWMWWEIDGVVKMKD